MENIDKKIKNLEDIQEKNVENIEYRKIKKQKKITSLQLTADIILIELIFQLKFFENITIISRLYQNI